MDITMTAQEVFDKVYAFIKEQGRPSVMRKGVDTLYPNSCAYRGENGAKCAVGCLIEDDAVAQMYDTLTSNSVKAVSRWGTFPNHLRPHLDLLVELQLAHDNLHTLDGSAFVAAWEEAMWEVAKKFNLKFPGRQYV